MEKYIKELLLDIREETNFCSEHLKDASAKRILKKVFPKIYELREGQDMNEILKMIDNA